MAEVIVLAEFFCLALALGVGIFTPLANTRMTGAGLFKVMTAICAVGVMLALAIHLSYAALSSPLVIPYALAFVAMVVSYLFHRDEKSVSMWILYGVQQLSLLTALYYFQNAHFFLYIYALSSILYMGVITYAMVLGHWYLVTPRLSVDPLLRANGILWGLAVIKLGILAYSLMQDGRFFVQGSTFGAGYMFNWVMLTMRVGWGYAVVLVMSYFSWRLIRMRSTQSATGVLYAMTFFVLVGELTAMYMYFRYGMFL
jgi:hypothetical protein